MILRVHLTEALRLEAQALPWWDDEVRHYLDLVISGEPAIEMDADGEPTGWLLLSHPGIGVREVWLLDLIRYLWRLSDSLGDKEARAAVAAQADTDWSNFYLLQEMIEAGELTRDQAVELAWQNAFEQAEAYGFPLPDLEGEEP